MIKYTEIAVRSNTLWVLDIPAGAAGLVEAHHGHEFDMSLVGPHSDR